MKSLEFGVAFKYPFNKAVRMWNILWVLVPIVGWFALGGYSVRIVQEFSKGKFKELPKMEFSNDLSLGFMMFLKSLPFIIVYAILVGLVSQISESVASLVDFVLGFFVIPMLAIHFINEEKVEAFFEFKILKSVWDNLGDYVLAVLKSIVLGIVFLVMIIVLVGLPAGGFTKNIFLADFYYRRVK
jgi:hypothetical protein